MRAGLMPDFVVSDTHFFHDNIVRYAGRPANHTELMVDRWMHTVKPTDRVLHLGDVLMGKRSRWQELPRLPGIITVLDSGNHDEPHKRRYIEDEWGWTFVPNFAVRYRGWRIAFSHYPIGVAAAEHATSNTDVAVVRGPGKHTINVHGHIHQKVAPSPQHINACVEWTGYSPVNLRTLLDRHIG